MSNFIKINKTTKEKILTLSLIRDLSKNKMDKSKKEINLETNSKEIAEIISKKLLEKIQEKIILK